MRSLVIGTAVLISTAALMAATMRPGAAAESSTPPSTTSTEVQGGGTLSEKLSNTDGVIHPKTDVDPGIKIAPPATGTTMPVIPPPGSPGGDPTVQPK